MLYITILYYYNLPYVATAAQIYVIYSYYVTMDFSDRVKEELNYQGMQVKQLAAKTGISKNTLDKYLSGQKVQPGVENAVKIAKALGVSVEALLEDNTNVSKYQFPEYKTIIDQYNSLNDFNKRTIRDLLKSLTERQ